MLIPILLQWPTEHASHAHPLHELSPQLIAHTPTLLMLAVGVHSLSMLLAITAIAVLVYEKFGLALLRRAWFNVDLLWAVALFIAGIVPLVW
jgi:hypothetical protein